MSSAPQNNAPPQRHGPDDPTREARFYFVAATYMGIDFVVFPVPTSIVLLVPMLVFVMSHLFVVRHINPSPRIQLGLSLLVSGFSFQTALWLSDLFRNWLSRFFS